MIRAAAFGLVAALAGAAGADPLPVPAQADWNAARVPLALAEGPALAMVETGRPDGAPVILLHGYTDNSRSWSLLAPHLAHRRVIMLDLRGHGAAEAPACCYGLDTLAQDVAGAMDALGIDRADVVGHSLGSMVGAVLAATRPERVERLVLISSALTLPAPARDWLWENVPALHHPIDPDSQFMLDWYWNPTEVEADFLDRERAESAARPAHVWIGVLEALSMTDWTGLAGRIAAPVLILWGDQDGFFGAPEQEALRAALPAARFQGFEGLGHNMFWEVPDRVGPMLADFLDGD